MKCHYIYDKEVGKVLIPGCWGSAIHGIEFCNCRDVQPSTFEQFEKKEYKETLLQLQAQVKELERENTRLNRIIKKQFNNKKIKGK